MKPTKNRYMCPDCGKIKMLFATEAEAKRFIRFNAGEINAHGGALRAYHCDACGGWHITHCEYDASYAGRTERLIDAYRSDTAKGISEAKAMVLILKMKTAGTEVLMSKKEFRKWAAQNICADDFQLCCNMAGEAREAARNGKESWISNG